MEELGAAGAAEKALPPPGLAFLRSSFPFLPLRPPFLLQSALSVCPLEAARAWERTCRNEGCARVRTREEIGFGGGATSGWSRRLRGVM